MSSGPRCGGAVGVEGFELDLLDLKVDDFGLGGAEKRIVEECLIERTIVVLGVGEWERMNRDNEETVASKFRRNVWRVPKGTRWGSQRPHHPERGRTEAS